MPQCLWWTRAAIMYFLCFICILALPVRSSFSLIWRQALAFCHDKWRGPKSPLLVRCLFRIPLFLTQLSSNPPVKRSFKCEYSNLFTCLYLDIGNILEMNPLYYPLYSFYIYIYLFIPLYHIHYIITIDYRLSIWRYEKITDNVITERWWVSHTLICCKMWATYLWKRYNL